MYLQHPVVRSVLDPKYIEHLLQDKYDIGLWKKCTYWLRGLNDTYKIVTEQGLYILRIYRRDISESDVSYELNLIILLKEQLKTSDTNVAEPIAQIDNSFYTVIEAPEGNRCAVLFRYSEGSENRLSDEAACYSFGRSAGQLHSAMDAVSMDQPRYELDTEFLVEKPLNRILSYIGEDHQSAEFLCAFARSLKQRMIAAAESGLEYGICHGDMHGSNNAYMLGEGFVHFDFEWSAKGWRAYDLAQVKISRKRNQRDQADMLWDAVLAGYRSVRTFSLEDEQAVDLFIAARRFWVMSLDVTFIETDSGALDFSDDWLNAFVDEFRGMDIVPQ